MLTLTPLDPLLCREVLIEWLTREEWPFHVNRRLTPEQVIGFIDQGLFAPPENLAFWISTGSDHRIGMLRVFELDEEGEDAPRFDLRLLSPYRDHGFGKAAVVAVTNLVFNNQPKLQRFEATTRDDNHAMQRVLEATGFIKEGQLRRAWPSLDGQLHDTLLYSILRCDWLSQCTSVPAFGGPFQTSRRGDNDGGTS